MQLPPLDRTLVTPPSPMIAELKPVTGDSATQGGITPAVLQTPARPQDFIGAPVGGNGPANPSAVAEAPNRDWTELRTHPGPKEPEVTPPGPPLYKLLIDQVQSLWRASAQTVDIAEEAQRQAVKAQGMAAGTDSGPIVYTDPTRVQKLVGSSSASASASASASTSTNSTTSWS